MFMEVTTTMDTHSSFRKKEVWNNLQEAFGRVPLVWKGRGRKGHAQSLILGLHPNPSHPRLLLSWSDEATANTLLLDVLRRDRKESFFFVHVGVVDGTETIIMLLVF